MAAKRALGRSFDSLLPTETLDEAFDPTAYQDEKVSQLKQLSVGEIEPDPNQPRKHFDEPALIELSKSFKEHGIVQPLVVVREGGTYIIVAGERRWRAAKLAGIKKVPALVRSLSNQHKLEISLIENVQRRDLSPLETATAYLKLRDQFSLKLEQISQRVGGKSIAVISNTIRLLALPSEAKQALLEQKISEGHARQILALEADPDAQKTLLGHITAKKWSVRRAEQFVIGYKKGTGEAKQQAAKGATRTQTPLTKKLAVKLNTDVKVKTTAKGGQLIIVFKNDHDLERINSLINGS